MAESPDYKELLRLLNEFEVRYLIVGGYAVMKYTEPHYTKDLDIWIESSTENSARVFEALRSFGAPLESDQITSRTFTERDLTYQIGVAPVRIDILTQITAIEFSDAWEKRLEGTIFDIPVHFISLDLLIANKQATGRTGDVEQLKQLSRREDSGK
ncbi:MAG: nucleotidyltransferase [Acidobacteria bacterium]|nr:nucleotidyltransferase [Acidobacteriota bacterium]